MPGINSVLCPIDFPEGSTHALELLHVVEWPWEEPPAPIFADLPREQAAALFKYPLPTSPAACRT